MLTEREVAGIRMIPTSARERHPDDWYGNEDAVTFGIVRSTGELEDAPGTETHGDISGENPEYYFRIRGRTNPSGTKAVLYEEPDDEEVEIIANHFPNIVEIHFLLRSH